ncbi:MAG TPA: anti-sigma factor [Mycobacteriales bacterium]|nr:anti-sigma factor [Mycobacteriales bacterium]
MTPGEPRPRPAHDHAAFEELAVGYALHALEPDEELRFAAHLASCPDCADAVADHEQTLAELALALPGEEPPAAVLESLRRATAPAGPPPPAPLPDGVVPLERARARRAPKVAQVRRSWLLSSAAAVTAALVGLGVWGADLRGDLDAESARSESLAAVVRTLETPGARTVQLADGEGTVRLVAVGGDDRLRLAVDGLAPNPDDTTYVLWGRTTSGDVVALGAFDVPTAELSVQEVGLQRPLDSLDALMVTHEHGRTVPASTDQPVLVLGRV